MKDKDYLLMITGISLQLMQYKHKAQSDLLQTVFTMVGTQNTDIAVLKHEMQGARADIIAIKATQSDHGELLKEHGQRLGGIEENQSKHSKRFDKLEEDIAALKATQDAQGQKLDLILQLLQRSGDEHG